jgi:S1-C subfamily serine protease
MASSAWLSVPLGVWRKDFQPRDARGAEILEVFTQCSPAPQAGRRAVPDSAAGEKPRSGNAAGDIIVGANGRPIRTAQALRGFLPLSSPGDVVKVRVTSADGNSYDVIAIKRGIPP